MVLALVNHPRGTNLNDARSYGKSDPLVGEPISPIEPGGWVAGRTSADCTAAGAHEMRFRPVRQRGEVCRRSASWRQSPRASTGTAASLALLQKIPEAMPHNGLSSETFQPRPQILGPKLETCRK